MSKTVLLVVFDGVKLLDVAGPAEVFAEANRFGADYRLTVASVDGQTVRTSVGIPLTVSTRISSLDCADTVMVAGGDELVGRPIDPDLVDALKLIAPRTRRLASVCTGAFILARAGLLSGRRATTHWRHAGRLARAFPDIDVEPDAIFVRDGDISSRAECFEAVADCVSAFGRIDVVGNVAGIARAEHVVEVPEAQYRQMMGVNVDGPFFVAQATIPHLLLSGGNLVNIASNAGLMGQAYTVVYCMTKGAVVQMTRALAMEFVKTNIRVNAIAPAGIMTALTTGFQIPADVDFELMAPYSGFRGMGEADDIAALFAFVASDEAANIHGAILSSDRGVTAG